jgi:peptidoglycan/xylan/chitin deacetylase (PgdA/CDA1 family)
VIDIRHSGIITLTFDDGLLCQFDNGYPLLRELDMKAVAFIPTGLVGGLFGEQQMMNLDHLRELTSAGWEIGSHTVSHVRLTHKDGATRLPLPEVEKELRESKQWLERNGFRVTSFAYPAGRHNEEVESIASRYYKVLRTTRRGLNDLRAGSNRLRVFDLHHGTANLWKPTVDEALRSKKWLIAMIHGVTESVDEFPSGRERFWMAKDDLARCLEAAKSSRLPVLTFQEILDGDRNRPVRTVR